MKHLTIGVVVLDPVESVARKLARSLASAVSRSYWTRTFTQTKSLVSRKQIAVVVVNCRKDGSCRVDDLVEFHREFPEIIVVGMSEEAEDEKWVTAVGATAFLTYPFETTDLIKIVRREMNVSSC